MSTMASRASNSADGRPFKRRRKWIRPDIQTKIVMRLVFVAVLAVLVNYQLGLILVSGGTAPPREALKEVPWTLLQSLGITLALVVPFAVAVAVVFSFKFAGPIYRFKRSFDELREGRWDRTIRLRNGDDLQDLAESLNQGLGLLADRIRAQHELLCTAGSLLGSGDGGGSEDRERVRAFLEQLGREQEEYRRRFGDGDPGEDPGEDPGQRPAAVMAGVAEAEGSAS